MEEAWKTVTRVFSAQFSLSLAGNEPNNRQMEDPTAISCPYPTLKYFLITEVDIFIVPNQIQNNLC